MKGQGSALRWLLGVLLVLALIWLLLLAVSQEAGPSLHSRTADGWATARLYAEDQGVQLEIPRNIQEAPQQPVWITAFPWRRRGSEERLDILQRFASEGGILAVAYAGKGSSPDEIGLLAQLGAPLEEARSTAPLGFRAWRRHRLADWPLRPIEGESREGRLKALDLLPAPPDDAQILYTTVDDDGLTQPLVFLFSYGRGEVLLFPAAAISNGRLGEEGNADFLENLCRWLGPLWAVDELAQGLPPADLPAVSRTNRRAFDLFGLHLLVLYGLGLWALGRRFGPPWRDPPVRLGSTGSFLAGLGTLHDRLGHHSDAAQRLLERTRQLHPDLRLPPDLQASDNPEAGIGTGKPAFDLLTLARRLVALRFPSRGAP